MSALAQLFNPPKLRHIPTRLIVSGMDVTSIDRLPPLPDDKEREAIKARFRNFKVRANTERRDRQRQAKKRYWLKNKEAAKKTIKEWYERNKNTPEYKERMARVQKEWMARKMQDPVFREQLNAKRRARNARKRNEAMLTQVEQQNGG